MTWEKMSKSKLNGIDPSEMFSEYGADTTRLITLADVAPTSHRNWSSASKSLKLHCQLNCRIVWTKELCLFKNFYKK